MIAFLVKRQGPGARSYFVEDEAGNLLAGPLLEIEAQNDAQRRGKSLEVIEHARRTRRCPGVR